MMKHNKLRVMLMVGAVLATPAFAQEPHSPHEHSYAESVYNNGPVLTLPDAIARAIDSSPRLKSVTAGFEAAKGAEDQAGYWPNPEIGFEAENVAGGGQFSGTDSAEYTYGLSQTVEIGGKRSARKNAAQALREAASTQVLSEKLNLERDVHIAYSEVLAEAEAVKLALDQEQLAKGVLATVSKRVEAAAEPEIQQSKAEVAYATSVIAREQEERQLRVAKEKLARLWGASKLDVSLDHAHFFDLQAPGALHSYREKLQHIPDMQRLAYLKAEKESLLELERAQAIPDPNFSLGVRDFRDSGDQAFLFGVSLPIPVLNQNSGNVAKARAEVTQVESDTRQAELMLEQELIESWQQWNTSFSEAERLKTKLLPAAEKSFKLARTGYEKGKFPYLEVLDAQRTLFDARAQFHDALKRYHSSRANVERLTSGTIE
ncbi:MAG: TolC family protein [Rickettsiales bacterium]|nr:TolC family protein [Rickettsiales bacterium]